MLIAPAKVENSKRMGEASCACMDRDAGQGRQMVQQDVLSKVGADAKGSKGRRLDMDAKMKSKGSKGKGSKGASASGTP